MGEIPYIVFMMPSPETQHFWESPWSTLINIGSRRNRQSVAVSSQSHTFKFADDDLEIEVEGMPGKKEKVEEAAEKTGEAIGKGLKESARVVKRVGKGIKKEIKKK